MDGKNHTGQSKLLMSERALASPHRRLKRKMIKYKDVWLDSTWELALAEKLDELMIRWVRPDPIPWTDLAGVDHNYFPDFYLPDFNLFLDPKNPYALSVQSEKINILKKRYKNIIFIDSLEKCKNFILQDVMSNTAII